MLSVVTKIILTLMTRANVAEGVTQVQTAGFRSGPGGKLPLGAGAFICSSAK